MQTKTLHQKVIVFLLFVCILTCDFAKSQVTIGAGKVPESFSILELVSSNSFLGGLRLPQIKSIEERDALESLILQDQGSGNYQGNGLVIYYLPAQDLEYWNGSDWVRVRNENKDQPIPINATNGLNYNEITDAVELGSTNAFTDNAILNTGNNQLSIRGSNQSFFNIKDSTASKTILSVDGLKNFVGIGTDKPEATLDVNGTMKYRNGTFPLAGKVLTADANGVASWQTVGVLPVTPSATFGNGVTFNLNDVKSNVMSDSTKWLDSGVRLTVPPGKWLVMVTVLVRLSEVKFGTNSSAWLRSTFIRENRGTTTPGDFSGPFLISGNIMPHLGMQTITGYVIINNISSFDRTYKYVVGHADLTDPWSLTQNIQAFGVSTAGENTIVAFALQQ